jgi:hypothetical protein
MATAYQPDTNSMMQNYQNALAQQLQQGLTGVQGI